MKKINVVDFFAGCGGLSYGFLMAGCEVILGIDDDKIALKTFKLNHPGADIITEDICRMSGKDIIDVVGKKRIDIVIGGPPCQGFSLSGPRKFDDPRNKLYLSFIRMVKEIKPKIFLVENVPGLVGLYKGQVKDEIIRRFSDIGYRVTYEILNSASYGVPQLRKRVFFVGIRNSKTNFVFPQTILSEKKYITCREAISDLSPLEGDIGEDPSSYPKVRRLTEYQKYCRNGTGHLHNHVGTNHSEQTKNVISHVPEGGNYKNLPKKYANTRNFHVAWTRYHSKKPSPTIDTGHRHHFHYKYNRVPTVRENARLQSFRDTFVFLGNKSQQYRQVGNAVPPLLAKILAEKIKEYL